MNGDFNLLRHFWRMSVLSDALSDDSRLVGFSHNLVFEAQIEINIAVLCLGIGDERKLTTLPITHTEFQICESPLFDVYLEILGVVF